MARKCLILHHGFFDIFGVETWFLVILGSESCFFNPHTLKNTIFFTPGSYILHMTSSRYDVVDLDNFTKATEINQKAVDKLFKNLKKSHQNHDISKTKPS